MFRKGFETQEKSHLHRTTKKHLFAEETKNDLGKDGKYLEKNFFLFCEGEGKYKIFCFGRNKTKKEKEENMFSSASQNNFKQTFTLTTALQSSL